MEWAVAQSKHQIALAALKNCSKDKPSLGSGYQHSGVNLISSVIPPLHITRDSEPVVLFPNCRFGFRSCFDIVEYVGLFILPPTLWAIIILLPRIKYFNNNVFMFEHEGDGSARVGGRVCV